MEDFERRIRRTRTKRRAAQRPEQTISPGQRERRAVVIRQKMIAAGIEVDVCIGCASDDVSTFEFDHISGRKHDDQLWPLCQACHREKTAMSYEEQPPTDTPRNVFEVIGRWLLTMAQYFELLIRVLRRFGNFLVDLARQGYGAELELPC